MMTRTLVVFLCALAALAYASAAVAQSISASPYSAYGIGILKSTTTSQTSVMAGTGVGLRDWSNINTLNPASYTSIKTVTQAFEIGLYVESDRYASKSKSTNASIGNLTNINYWFRFNKRWAGMVGLSPVSSVNYNIYAPRTFDGSSLSTVSYSGTGGLSEFYFGNGVQITEHLSIGANLSYVLGTINQSETIENGVGAGTGLSSRITAHGLTGNVGIQYEFSLPHDHSLTIGATYKPEVKLYTYRNVYAQEGYATDTLWSESVNQQDYVLPNRFAGGITWRTRRMLYSVDATYSEWSKAETASSTRLQNTNRVSFGIERKGNPNANRYFGSIDFRSGFYTEAYYARVAGRSFDFWGLTAGLSAPIFSQHGAINVSYGHSRTANVPGNLISQQSNRIEIGLTFRDLWGVRRKFD
jgi:hypothetical protein